MVYRQLVVRMAPREAGWESRGCLAGPLAVGAELPVLAGVIELLHLAQRVLVVPAVDFCPWTLCLVRLL